MDNTLLGAPAKDVILPGGIIGGSIALALRAVAAKAGALIILIAFTISQVVLIFNISITDTATKTANVIKTKSQQASEALRQGKEWRERERIARERTLAQQGGRRPSAVRDPRISPFEEIPGPQGFIDLEGTPVKMNQEPWSEREKVFDFDLTNDTDPAPEAQKVEVPPEPRVDFGFSNPKAPVAEKIPDENEPQWIDLPPLPGEEPRPGTILPSPTVSPYQEKVEVRVHEQGGTQIRVPDLNEMERDTSSQNLYSQEIPASPIPEMPPVAKVETPVPAVQASIPAVSQVEENRNFVDNAASAKTSVPDIPPTRRSSNKKYAKAPTNLLSHDKPQAARNVIDGQDAEGMKLVAALRSFGIETRLTDVTRGPAITRFEVAPAPGIKVSRITNLSDDIALALAAQSIRIEAPIPGKSAVGIEVPNKTVAPVHLGNLLDSPSFKNSASPLTVALGKDIPGSPILCDLAKMPHLLIAGSTGSGKSVCINSILISILCHASPSQVRMIMVDPKVVELAIYNGIPHLLCPVVTDAKKAANALNWAVREMTDRYAKFAEASVRDFKGYNEYQRMNGEKELPLILVVIDELADLMQVASKEVEESISRLTAMARAAGIHLLIATQRPSVDVITGVIKANIPSRIAFAVSSQVDSRTILDMAGAEKLLGKGDMLYYPQSAAKPVRGQGALVTDKEVEEIISYIKANNDVQYDEETAEAIVTATKSGSTTSDSGSESGGEDEVFYDAVDVVIQTGYASVSLLQRRLNLGYPRASRLIDRMAEKGYIGPFEGSKPRKILIDPAQWLEIKAKKG
ncbi:MAG: DNA translocase FtsK [Clostridiales bacterium]|nr:DNA translocase FtsK [Clostridiales bacterium]